MYHAFTWAAPPYRPRSLMYQLAEQSTLWLVGVFVSAPWLAANM